MTSSILHIHVRSHFLPTPSSLFPDNPVTLQFIGHYPLITCACFAAAAEDGVGRALVLLQAGLVSATVFLAQRHAATATHPICVFWNLVIAAANKTPHRPALPVFPSKLGYTIVPSSPWIRVRGLLSALRAATDSISPWRSSLAPSLPA